MKITVEQNGDRWAASDGTHHVEGEDPEKNILGFYFIPE